MPLCRAAVMRRDVADDDDDGIEWKARVPRKLHDADRYRPPITSFLGYIMLIPPQEQT